MPNEQPKPIPGPQARYFLSQLRKARVEPLAYILELSRTYGDVSRIWLGPSRLIIINQPDAIKHVLLDHSANYGRPAFVSLLRRVVGNGLLFSEGDYWLRQRRTMQPMFHRERIKGFAEIMSERVAARVQHGASAQPTRMRRSTCRTRWRSSRSRSWVARCSLPTSRESRAR